jgi:phage recombination protein Bet
MEQKGTEVAQQHRGVLADMADRYQMNPQAFEATLRGTVVPASTTREQFAAFLLVARQYGLDPVTKQIYAYPNRNGGIQPVVSIDGWMTMINNHPQFDGMEFDDIREDGQLIAVTCRMYRKDRNRPVAVTEYMSECKQKSPTWDKWPARMLRHKAAIQAARYAFSFSGIVDEDEAQRMIDITPKPEAPKPEHKPDAPSRLASILSQAAPEVEQGELIEAEEQPQAEEQQPHE